MHLMVAPFKASLWWCWQWGLLWIGACLTEGICGTTGNVQHAAWLVGCLTLIINNLKCTREQQKKRKKRGRNEMRDANASVSNYFHILWRKFSLEGPKTNFQPKRNETKMLQLQLRSTTTATATIKPAATEATNLKKASRLLHRKILFFTPLPATWRKREGEKKTRQELNATSKKGGKKQETRNMVKTKRQPARQAGWQAGRQAGNTNNGHVQQQ